MEYKPYPRTDGKYDIIADSLDGRDYLHIGLPDEVTAKIVCEKLLQAHDIGYHEGYQDGQ